MALPDRFETDLTRKLGIRYPIMVAGMGHVTGPDLAAAVSNAGGIGTIGAIGMSTEGLRAAVKELKGKLEKGDSISGTLPFGVDLLLPQVGGNARKTNKDYTGGQLDAIVDMMIEEKVPLFVCAVGIPPKWVVEKLHRSNILVMNMAGHPKHVTKALDVGVDLICATGTEGGAHSGDISTMVLLPQVADQCKGKAVLVGGGGLFDGRGIAACMALGASGVWMGTRFLMSPEANVPSGYHEQIKKATSADTRRIEIYTGRPLRVIKNPVNDYWAQNEGEMRELLNKGVVPIGPFIKSGGEYAPGKKIPRDYFGGPNPTKEGYWNDVRKRSEPWKDVDTAAAGQAVGALSEVKPAKEIVAELLSGLIATLQQMGSVGGQAPAMQFPTSKI